MNYRLRIGAFGLMLAALASAGTWASAANTPNLVFPVRGAASESISIDGRRTIVFRSVPRMPVRAPLSGKIASVEGTPDSASVVISAPDSRLEVSIRTLYNLHVRSGQQISAGAYIGEVDGTGRLEIAVLSNGVAVDARPLLRVAEQLPPEGELVFGAPDGSPAKKAKQSAMKALRGDPGPDPRTALVEAIAAEERENGYATRDLAALLTGLADLHRSEGRYDDALPAAQQARQVAEELKDNALLAAAISQEAGIYDAQERLSDALPLFRLSLARLLQTPGARDDKELQAQIINAYWNVTNSLIKLERYGEADETFAAAVHWMRPNVLPKIQKALCRLMVNSYLKQKRYTEADEILNVLEAEESAETPLRFRTAHMLYLRQAAYRAAGEADLSRALAMKGQAALAPLLGRRDVPTSALLWYIKMQRELGFPDAKTSAIIARLERYFRANAQHVGALAEFAAIRVEWMSKRCVTACSELLNAEAYAARLLHDAGELENSRLMIDRAAADLARAPKDGENLRASLSELGFVAVESENWARAVQFFELSQRLRREGSYAKDDIHDSRKVIGLARAKARLNPEFARTSLMDGAEGMKRLKVSAAMKLTGIGSILAELLKRDDRELAIRVAVDLVYLWPAMKREGHNRVPLDALMQSAEYFDEVLRGSSNSGAMIDVYEALIAVTTAERGYEDAYTVALYSRIIDEHLAADRYKDALLAARAAERVVLKQDAFLQPEDKHPVGGGYFRAVERAADAGRSIGPGIPVNPDLRAVLQAQYLRAVGQPGATVEGRPEREDLQSAFRALQHLSHSGLASATIRVSTELGASDPQLAELIRRRATLLGEWDGAHQRLRGDASNMPSSFDDPRLAPHAMNIADRVRIAMALDRTALEIQAIAPASSLPSEVVTLEAVQAALKPGELAIWLNEADGQAFAFLITSEGARLRRLSCTAADARAQFVALKQGWRRDGSDQPGVFDVQASYRTFTLLFGEDGKDMKGVHALVLVQSELTSNLNLALLARPGPTDGEIGADYRAVDWIVRSVGLRIVASPAELAARAPANALTAATFLGIGAADAYARPSGQGPSSTATMMADRLASLPTLPQAERELDLMRVSLALPSDIITGSRATEMATRRALSNAPHDLVVFATHGLQAGEIPGLYQPALVLSKGSSDDSDDDGVLTATEVASLHVAARIVVLAACNTAAPDGSGGERFSGLVLSFLHAGAKEVLATDWPLYSETAQTVTVPFMRGAAQGVPSDTALSAAMTSLIDSADGRFSHPYYWAGFILVGAGPKSAGAPTAAASR